MVASSLVEIQRLIFLSRIQSPAFGVVEETGDAGRGMMVPSYGAFHCLFVGYNG